MKKFSHIDKNKATMVDISKKKKSAREAHAFSKMSFSKDTFNLIKKKGSAKGEIFSTARIAGIQAAKKTSELIPLCHNIKINSILIDFQFSEKENSIIIESIVKTNETTGVEMEAMMAVSIAALTIYDMCKSYEKGILIHKTKLSYKSGGKSGVYVNDKF